MIRAKQYSAPAIAAVLALTLSLAVLPASAQAVGVEAAPAAASAESPAPTTSPVNSTMRVSDDLPALDAFTVVELDRVGSGRNEANDINDHGIVVGKSAIVDSETDPDSGSATKWNADGTVAEVWGTGSSAVAVNELGTMVGSVNMGAEQTAATAWKDGVQTILPDEGYGSTATAVNNHDQIVGWLWTSEDLSQPVMWTLTPGGADIEPLPMPPGATAAAAVDINDAGAVLLATAYTPGGTPESGAWIRNAGSSPKPLGDAGAGVRLTERGYALTEGGTGGQLQFAGFYEPGANVVKRLNGNDGFNLDAFGTGMNDHNDIVGTMMWWRGFPPYWDVVWPEGSNYPIKLEPLLAQVPGYQEESIDFPVDINNSRHILVALASSSSVIGNEYIVMIPDQRPARLDEARLESIDYPSGDWQSLPTQGVVQSTQGRVRFTVQNPDTLGSHVVSVELRDRASGKRLKDGYWFEALDPLESREGTIEFDTTGLDFTESGVARAPLQIELIVKGDGEEVTTVEEDIPILPDPVVLVHGFNSNAEAWAEYGGYLKSLHPGWQSFAVGDHQAPGVMDTGSLSAPDTPGNTIAQNAAIMAEYIEWVRDRTNAKHIDIVAHSMGGLISRQYVQEWMPMADDGRPFVNQLIMLGTPNAGSPCADMLSLAGMRELRRDVLAEFNDRVTNRKGVEASILIGTYVPFTCSSSERGDGVVAISSARYGGWDDNAEIYQVHTSLTNREAFDFFVWPELLGGGPRLTDGISPLSEAPADDARADEPETALVLSRSIQVPAGDTLRVPISVEGESRIGAALVAAAGIRARLLDPSGAVIAEGAGGEPLTTLSSPDGAAIRGSWTLELTGADAPTTVAAAVYLQDSETTLTATAETDEWGVVRMSADLVHDGQSHRGATVEARFLDRGGNVRARIPLSENTDGTYSGASSSMPEGVYRVTVSAAKGDLERATLLDVTVPPPSRDTDKPQVAVEHRQPDGGDWYRDAVDVTIRASDTQSGVQYVSYDLEGATQESRETTDAQLSMTISAEGATDLWWFARDFARNFRRNDVAKTFHVDATEPIVTISGVDGAVVDPGGELRATYSCVDALSGLDECAADVESGALLPTDVPGVHEFTVRASDLVGHVVARTATYTVSGDAPEDTTPPEIAASMPDPTESGWFSGPTETTLSASDAGSGVATVFWRFAGGETHSAEADVVVVPVDAAGRTDLEFWAVDRRGNSSSTRVQTVLIDTAAPRIEVSSPLAGVHLPVDAEQAMDFAAFDDDSGVARVHSVVRGPNQQSVELTRGDPLPTGVAGEYELTVVAVDAVGRETRASVPYFVDEPAADTIAPTVAVSLPHPTGGWFAAPATVRLRASDDGSGVAAVAWRLDGAVSDSQEVEGSEAEFVVDGDGETTVTYLARDHAGNRSAPQQIVVRMDRGAPVITLNGVEDGETYLAADLGAADFSCDDLLSGIVDCEGSIAPGAPLPRSVGSHMLDVRATDVAGNQATVSVHYAVVADPVPGPGTEPSDDVSPPWPSALAESGPGGVLPVGLLGFVILLGFALIAVGRIRARRGGHDSRLP